MIIYIEYLCLLHNTSVGKYGNLYLILKNTLAPSKELPNSFLYLRKMLIIEFHSS